MEDNRCPVEERRARKGHPCAHVMAKRKNCRGPFLSQARVCPVRKEAQYLAKGWRLRRELSPLRMR